LEAQAVVVAVRLLVVQFPYLPKHLAVVVVELTVLVLAELAERHKRLYGVQALVPLLKIIEVAVGVRQ
jgi:hypothetical protein